MFCNKISSETWYICLVAIVCLEATKPDPTRCSKRESTKKLLFTKVLALYITELATYDRLL